MGVRFYDNKVLFDGNAVAMHEDCCCCVLICSVSTSEDLDLTISGVKDCPTDPRDCALINGIYRCVWDGTNSWRYSDATHSIRINCADKYIQGYVADTNGNCICYRNLNINLSCIGESLPNLWDACGQYAYDGQAIVTVAP